MRPMVSRSTFSWDHSEVSEDITSRRQNRRTKFLITRAPRERSKRGLYSLKSRLGAECIPVSRKGRRHCFLAGLSDGGIEVFSSDGFCSPAAAGFIATPSSAFVPRYCTIKEIRRLDGSRGFSSLRRC